MEATWDRFEPRTKFKIQNFEILFFWIFCPRFKFVPGSPISHYYQWIYISWVKRIYGDCFHGSKTIPRYLLKKTFSPSFKFHSNIYFNKSNFKELLPFHRQMLVSWSQYLFASPETPSQVLSQFL